MMCRDSSGPYMRTISAQAAFGRKAGRCAAGATLHIVLMNLTVRMGFALTALKMKVGPVPFVKNDMGLIIW